MEKIYVLYNPMAGTIKKEIIEKTAKEAFPEDKLFFQDATKIGDMKKYVSGINGAKIFLIGGDGTLNKFINLTSELELKNIWYAAGGSGNDFARDIGCEDGKPVCIDKYLENIRKIYIRTELILMSTANGMDNCRRYI